MYKKIRINENHIENLVIKILNENISINSAYKIFNSHPGSMDGEEFFPKIIPKQYKRTYIPGGNWWQNSCASKMSIAMLKAGYKIDGNYQTEIPYNGVPAKSFFNPSSQAFIKIFEKEFGKPTILTLNGLGLPEKLKGKVGVYVITTSAWSDAAGHVDAFNGIESAGGFDHWDITGTVRFWGVPIFNSWYNK